MNLYIDPGTGSMLFAILTSLFGLAFYFLRGLWIRLKFRLGAGKTGRDTENEKMPFVIFSDNRRYWNVFEPVLEELDLRGIDTVYVTASEDDPGLLAPFAHVRAEFIGEGNKAIARMNLLRADVVLSTTPGLDVYQWKRSKEVGCYIHIPHAASDITLYSMFGTDYYDAALLSGLYQGEQIRALEKLRGLPEKELVYAGIPYFDKMKERLEAAGRRERMPGDPVTVLLAPTWGKSGILTRFGERLIRLLSETDHRIIIRPHPESFLREKDLIEDLKHRFPDSDKISWNTDNDNFDALWKSDILISDFSGVLFDFALVFDKPVIYTDTGFDKSPYDAWWLDEELWTLKILPQIGAELRESDMDEVGSLIRKCLDDPGLKEGRDKAREETWMYRGEGAKRVADYIKKKLKL